MPSFDTPAPPATARPRLAPHAEGVHAAFEALGAAAGSVPRVEGAVAAKLRRPLGRLVGTAQHRDIFDQRMAHATTALEGAAARTGPARAAAERVCAAQLGAISDMLEEVAGTAADAWCGLADLAGELGEDAAAGLSAAAEEGHAAADALTRAADALRAEGAALDAGIDPGLGADMLRTADLAWLEACYTMEEERRIHALALAGPAG